MTPSGPPAAGEALRIVFAGTPAVALPALRRVAAGRHALTGVLTRTDAPVGRKRVLTPSPVAQAAEELGVPVVKADRPGDAATDRVRDWRPDLGVIVAYGALIREPLLGIPRHGWINLHFSDLPRWRGAAPVQRAILAGDEATALDVFRLVPQLDAGDVLASRPVSLLPDETAGEALERLALDGADLLAECLDALASGSATAVPQTGEATYASKLTREDGRLDWSDDALHVYARFRGVTPEPGAFTTLDDAALKITGMRMPGPGPQLEPGVLAGASDGVLVGTGTVPLLITHLQPAGKRAMPAVDWWRGNGRLRPRLR